MLEDVEDTQLYGYSELVGIFPRGELLAEVVERLAVECEQEYFAAVNGYGLRCTGQPLEVV